MGEARLVKSSLSQITHILGTAKIEAPSNRAGSRKRPVKRSVRPRGAYATPLGFASNCAARSIVPTKDYKEESIMVFFVILCVNFVPFAVNAFVTITPATSLLW